MSGDVTPGEGRSILAHLLTDCAVCREITGPLAPFGRTALLEDPTEPIESGESKRRSPTTAALLASLRQRERAIETEREDAPSLLAELEAQEQPIDCSWCATAVGSGPGVSPSP